MRINQTYIQFLMLVNRNASNNKTNIDKPRFILLYNDISSKYVEWILEKRNEDVIRNVSILLVTDKKLTKVSENNSSESYKLPKDYFDFSNLQVFANKGECKKQKLSTFEIKSDDSEELLIDDNFKPSFEYREVFYFLSEGNVKIFKDDFQLDEIKLSYYRYPKKVDIEGYKHFETGLPSQNIDPEFDDKVVLKILLAMSKQFSMTNSDATKYGLDKDALFSEI